MEINYVIIGFGILYIGSFVVQSILDWGAEKLEKKHESNCSKTEHYYQYSLDGGRCAKECRDKRPTQTFIIS